MRWLMPLLAMACASPVFPQGDGLPSSESLSYRVEWRLITAGRAALEWKSTARPDPGWQVKLRLESVGLVSKLFRVEDDYLANLNHGYCALATQMITREGSRQRDTRVTFDYHPKRASYLERDQVKNSVILAKEIDIPACVHDVIGGLFFLRTLNLEPGQSTQVPISDGKKSVMARVEAQQRETIKVPAGTFKAIRYEVFLFDNVLYRRPAHLYLWLSDDRRKLPVQLRVKMRITTGTITFELEKAGA